MKNITITFWLDRPVLVTGCTGLLGSWLTEALIASGAKVVGLIRDRIPDSKLAEMGLIKQISVVSGEVEDYQLIERTLNEYQIKTVFHLAAQTIVGIANQSALSTFESNIRGTWQLLEGCRRTDWVDQVVIASSDKAYGSHERLPYSEDFPLEGRHPYDVSKSCADLISQSYWHTYRLPVCVTRCGNLFGGGDLNFNRLIPGTIHSIIRNESPVIRSDGTFTRDYIYVEDAAEAYMKLAAEMGDNKDLHGHAFNFSYESPLKALEVVEKILDLMDKKELHYKILNSALNEIPHQYLGSGKARNMLNWSPRYNFEEGLKRTIPWYLNLIDKEALND